MFVQRFFPGLALCGALLSAPSLCAQSSAASAAVEKHAYGARLKLPGVHNAGKINDRLYRGAQPGEQAFAELKKLGISTIVDLRGEGAEKIKWERKQTEALGMRFVHIPVSGWSPPRNEQVEQFLSLFQGDSAQKVFVHCRFGDDRTGVFVAAYRMAAEKWSAEEAMKEMYYFGFNGFWHPAMKAYIREFPNQFKPPSLATLTVRPATP